MAQVVNIPHSIDEKDSFDESGDIDTTRTDPRGYTVPSLDIDLSMEPDRSRKRRFSVSAESNANDDSDFDDDLDDDEKSQSHSRNNSYGSNNSGNNNNNTNNNNHSNHSSGSASSTTITNGSKAPNENNNTNNTSNSNSSKYNGFGRKKKHFIRKIYPKTQSAKSRIYASVSDLFLWNGLDSEQQNLLIDAMFEKKVKKNENIITQGDRGDYFYVIESGVYEVWKTESSNSNNNTNGITNLQGVGYNSNEMLSSEAIKVYEYNNRGSFGELALMYNSPRAATVKSKSDGILWAVDRKTFRHIIVGSTARKRHRYDNFLKKIEAFDKLPGTTTSQIADILEGFEFRQNEKIIEQGSSDCQKFYLIQRGTANVVIRTNDGQTHIVSKLRDGDFFGERALLENDVRSASVIVTSKTMICCAMDKASFMRLLHSLYDYFKIRIDSYTNASDLGNEILNGDDDIHSDLGSDQE